MPAHPNHRAPRHHANHNVSHDGGAIPVALAIGAGVVVVVIAVLLGAVSELDGSPAACQQQPGPSGQAQEGIPATYLELYRRTGQQSGIAWNVLAAVGKAESNHGRDHQPGSGIRSGANWAGAAGPMQIGIGGKATNNWGGPPRHPAGRRTGGYATDGNNDGTADVYDPADAIPAAANMLKDHGAPGDIRGALLDYNPSTEYVDNVLRWARRYAHRQTQLVAPAQNPVCEQAALGPLPSQAIGKVVGFARAQLGKPYIYGAEGPDTFDCSGLTMMAYRAAGIQIPRVTYQQWRHGTRIRTGQEQPGDLVFFRMEAKGPGHVGLVYDTRRGLMIAAPRSGEVVKIQSYRRYPGGPVGFRRPSPRS